VTGDRLRIMVVDDDPRIRSDFRDLLELEADLEVVAVAADGAEAVALSDRLRPDVVVMDVRMPVMNGIEATGLIRATNRDACRVLVVTTFDLDEYVLGAIRSGASGFLLKDQGADRLAEAVRIVAAGEAVVAPRATVRLLRELVPPPPQPTRGGELGLSPRELDVVRLLTRGLSNAQIAAEAYISAATVKTHISSILSKLHLTSRLQIAVWAHEHGIV
jgi:DNA-binding NarL/FixJ family response regulator